MSPRSTQRFRRAAVDCSLLAGRRRTRCCSGRRASLAAAELCGRRHSGVQYIVSFNTTGMHSQMQIRIHVFGASGSGTTTLGSYLARELKILHLDSDVYYWKQTDPPYVEKNDPAHRIELMRRDSRHAESWVLSGSLCSWGDALLSEFTLAVFLYVEPGIRMARLLAREQSGTESGLRQAATCTDSTGSSWPGPRATTMLRLRPEAWTYTRSG